MNTPIWFNSLILNGRMETIFYKNWYEAGIFKISDIVINGRISNFEQISNKYPIVRNDLLKYYGLLSMLPSAWKNRINQIQHSNTDSNSHFSNNVEYKILSLAKKTKICSAVVTETRTNLTTFPVNAFEKWKHNLNINFDRNDFLNLFKKMYFLTKDNRILIFHFRFLHRNTITNKNLHLWDFKKRPEDRHNINCTFCNNSVETIEHLFYECIHTRKLWEDLFQWIYDKTGLRINFSKFEIILSAANDDLKIFNLIFMIVRKQIYSIRCLKNKLNIFVIKYHLTQYYKAEKLIACKNGNLTNFNSKWEIVQECFETPSLPNL